MNNFEAGQKVRVIGDTFQIDPHGVPLGEEIVIEEVVPAIPYEAIPPAIKLMFAMTGKQGKFDIPERIHAKYGDVKVNIPLTDVEPVTYEPKKVKMLEDDSAGGFVEGDVFEAFYIEYENEYMFRDKDGDSRFLIDHLHEEIK